MNFSKYSLEEVKAAGLTVRQLRYNGYFVDIRRNSSRDENVEILKKLELKAIPKQVHKVKEKKPKAAKKAKGESAGASTNVAAAESKMAKLEDLAEITEKDIAKLKDMGIDSPAKLAKENLKDVSKMTRINQKQLKAWIEQIK